MKKFLIAFFCLTNSAMGSQSSGFPPLCQSYFLLSALPETMQEYLEGLEQEKRSNLGLFFRYWTPRNTILQAEVNQVCDEFTGDTPLHLIGRWGNVDYEVIEILVARGASLKQRNLEGQTPYEVARDRIDSFISIDEVYGLLQLNPDMHRMKPDYLGFLASIADPHLSADHLTSSIDGSTSLCDLSFLQNTSEEEMREFLNTGYTAYSASLQWYEQFKHTRLSFTSSEINRICDRATGERPLHLIARSGGVSSRVIRFLALNFTRQPRPSTLHPVHRTPDRRLPYLQVRNLDGQIPYEIARDRISKIIPLNEIYALNRLDYKFYKSDDSNGY